MELEKVQTVTAGEKSFNNDATPFGKKVISRQKVFNCLRFCELLYEFTVDQSVTKPLIYAHLSITDADFEFFSVPETDTQCVLVQKDKDIYLVFEGTVSEADALVDLLFELAPVLNTHRHRGFYFACDKTYGQIGEAVKKRVAVTPGGKVIITGHSLGGAMAMMYAALFKERNENFPIDSLITFGQPRCGNVAFAKYFEEFDIPYVRFVNEKDRIPDVPPQLDKHNWTHAGLGVLFDSNGMSECKPERDAGALFRSVMYVLKALYLFFTTGLTKENLSHLANSIEHRIPWYRSNIEKHLKGDVVFSAKGNNTNEK